MISFGERLGIEEECLEEASLSSDTGSFYPYLFLCQLDLKRNKESGQGREPHLAYSQHMNQATHQSYSGEVLRYEGHLLLQHNPAWYTLFHEKYI